MSRRFLDRLDPRDERGVTVLIVALLIPVLFGMLVLAVDLGGLTVRHRGLVNANDAASLAAADSFARNEAQIGTNESPAVISADRFALENVADAVHDTSQSWWTATAGLQASGCDPSSCGSVRVRYQAGQSLFFAPVLGLSDHVTAHGTATAIWGPAGGGHPIPVTIRADWLEARTNNGECDARVPNVGTGTGCAFWLQSGQTGDGEHQGGNGQWGWISLTPCPGNRCGWDTGSARYKCPSISSSDIRGWLAENGPDVTVHPLPTPTYVCTGGGSPGDFFTDLDKLIGQTRQFPVNDASGQVDDKGLPCPPDTDCTPAQFDIVGFSVLRIDDVIPGDQDGEPGDPHVLCSPPLLHDFDPSPPDNTWDLDSQTQCPLTGLHHPDHHSDLFPRIRREHDDGGFDGGLAPDCGNVDYCYDGDSHVITWLRKQRVQNARVDWLFVVPPTPGKCGLHDQDENAICLVASWQGYQPNGINPGGGVDFGLRAVRLSE